MAYLLDTNVVIHAMDGLESVLNKLLLHDGTVVISALNLAELQRGLFKNAAHTALRRSRLSALLPKIPVLSFGAAAAESLWPYHRAMRLGKRP